MPIRYCQFQWATAIAFLIVLIPFQTHGQYMAALKAHTFRTIDRLYTVGYEQAITKHLSAELSLQGGYYVDVHPNSMEDYEVTGIGAIGSIRYYPFTKNAVAPRGFFGYTALRYVDFNETFLNASSGDRYEVGGTIKNVGAGFGYKFVYRRFGLEGFVGWGVGRLESDDEEYRNNIPEFYRMGIQEQEHFPQLDVALCYMFNSFSRE